MEILLQSHDAYNEIAFLNLDTGAFSTHSKDEFEKQRFQSQGHFSVQDDNAVVCFFRVGGSLYFRLDQTTIQFQNNDRIMLEPLPDDRYLFSIERNNEIVFSWEYQRAEIYPPISAFQIINPLASEEDFDIFIFIQNVINNVERKKRVFV